MTGTSKGWTVDESLTCKRRLIKMYREDKHDRTSIHSNKYTEKGTRMEQDAISLYSRFRNIYFKKNTKRIQNDYFDGEIDIINLPETIDIKCSWSLDTFPHPMVDKPDKDYEYQGQAYMDLSGAKKHIIAYCLVNAPGNLVLFAKEKLWYSKGCPPDSDQDYADAKVEIEKSMIFDMAQFKEDNPHFDIDCKEWVYDMSIEDRIVEFTIERNDSDIERMYLRVDECREWMNRSFG